MTYMPAESCCWRRNAIHLPSRDHPDSGQWALHFSNLANGELSEPVYGGFVDGRGSFYGMDTVNGRRVLVRFLIIPLSRNQWRFEQAYSVDGGSSWEDNWIAIDTRRPATTAPAP